MLNRSSGSTEPAKGVLDRLSFFIFGFFSFQCRGVKMDPQKLTGET
jgi:hypothetical protein